MNTITWIVESCEHQNATEPEDFIGMSLAYAHLIIWDETHPTLELDLFLIRDLFRFVKHDVDITMRWLPATFDNGTRHALPPEFIYRQLKLLCQAVNQGLYTPEEFYQNFEEIHPCHDGNGRVGALLYNFLNGSLTNPEHPPRFITR